eukprot:RCo015655
MAFDPPHALRNSRSQGTPLVPLFSPPPALLQSSTPRIAAVFREDLRKAQLRRLSQAESYLRRPYGGFAYLPSPPSTTGSQAVPLAFPASHRTAHVVSHCPSACGSPPPPSWQRGSVGSPNAVQSLGLSSGCTSSLSSAPTGAEPVALPAQPSLVQGMVGSHCQHYMAWRILRSKRGYIHYACGECGIRWRVMTAKRRLALQQDLPVPALSFF